MHRNNYWVLSITFVLLTSIFPTSHAQDPAYRNSKLQIKVVGGATVPISYAPWQVALLDLSQTGRGDWDKQFCGGSIVSQTWILTAAHCLEGVVSLRSLRVLSGQAILNTRRLSSNLATVKNIVIHNSYNSVTNENDIALIQLTNPLSLNPGSVELIQIPSSKPLPVSTGRISGWGYTWPNDGNSPPVPVPGQVAYPSELMGGDVSILSDAACLSALGSEFDQTSMLCAQGGVNNQGIVIDTCYGDSGGPLAVLASGTWFLVGVTSWGIGCGWTMPGVYTNVPNYKLWVESKISSKNPQVITFSPPSSLTLAQSPFMLTISSSSGLSPVISSNTLLVCSVSGVTLTLLSPGMCNLSANQNGNGIFEAAPSLNRSISVLNTLTSQTISFSPPASLVLSQSPYILSVSSSSGLMPVVTTKTPRICSIVGFGLTLEAAGKCTLTVTQAGNIEFAPANSITVNINIRRR
jgi:secreted trypsin-like serine protease